MDDAVEGAIEPKDVPINEPIPTTGSFVAVHMVLEQGAWDSDGKIHGTENYFFCWI